MMYLLGIGVLGTALIPPAALIVFVWGTTLGCNTAARIFALCWTGVACYFLFGLALIFLVGFLRSLFCLNLKAHVECQGESEKAQPFSRGLQGAEAIQGRNEERDEEGCGQEPELGMRVKKDMGQSGKADGVVRKYAKLQERDG